MCLAIPGRVIAIEETGPDGRVARVDYGIAIKPAYLLYLPEAKVGDYVIVQAGFASTLLSESEALEALECARQIDASLATAAASREPPAAPGAGLDPG
jgi:hydrogenase expression/formation protein HypC